MKKKIFGVLQRIGRSFMLPIAVLPIAGMFLGIGSSLTNEATIASLGLESILGTGTTLNHILILLMSVGQTIFDNLPLIFASSVALGMAKKFIVYLFLMVLLKVIKLLKVLLKEHLQMYVGKYPYKWGYLEELLLV